MLPELKAKKSASTPSLKITPFSGMCECSRSRWSALILPKTSVACDTLLLKGSRIVAAACVMPLTSGETITDRQMGLRHRAALGISEVSDAVAIIISEETGTISVAHSGRMIQRLDSDKDQKVSLAEFQARIATNFKTFDAAVIKDWVHREVAKEPTVSIPNALGVLETRKGDCNEHTVLFNALARASGIPAKTVVGVVYLRGSFYYHAWSEIWLGSWVSLDPVLNQFPADVTHIKFLEGEIDRQIDIVQLIGKLKIEVL